MNTIKPLKAKELIEYLNQLDENEEVKVVLPNQYDDFFDILEDVNYYIYEDGEKQLALIDCRLQIDLGR